ncbi:hypothetical protein Leryth_026995, partial [Lithospermum erythrorhizon]
GTYHRDHEHLERELRMRDIGHRMQKYLHGTYHQDHEHLETELRMRDGGHLVQNYFHVKPIVSL